MLPRVARLSPLWHARSPLRPLPVRSLFLRPSSPSVYPTLAARPFSSYLPILNQNKSKGISDDDATPVNVSPSERAKAAGDINLQAKLTSRNSDKNQGVGDIFRLFRLVKDEVWPLIGAFTLLFLSAAISMTVPLSIGKIMDVVSEDEKDPEDADQRKVFGLPLKQFYIALGGLFIIGAMCNMGRVYCLRVISERLSARLRAQLYKRTVTQDAEFFDANRVGDLISRLSTDAQVVAKSVTNNMSDGVRSIISGVVGLGMMSYVSLKLATFMMLVAPPVAIIAVIYGKKLRHISRELQTAVGGLTKVSEERLGNIRTAQSFGGEIQEVRLYNSKIRAVFDIGKKDAMANGMFHGFFSLSGNMTILALLVMGSQMVSTGQLSLGDLTSFMLYAGYTGGAMHSVSSFYSELMKGAGAASRLFELNDREPAINATKGPHLESARGNIDFNHVAFAYPTRPSLPIFTDLNFSIPAGSNVCIVGPSGGGKSTITSLLLRFYDPTKGYISIGGNNIRDFNVRSLRKQIGVVSQEPVLFSGTIASNIRYGKPEATRDEIIEAARKANCTFLADFPQGIDTQVGARGTQLSGGQKQRIAIARALIKNPAILILDEATSALDTDSESSVNEALQGLMDGNSTTISIAHRLSTIKRADRVIVLSNEGTVAEQGKFTELYANHDSALSNLLRAKEEEEVAEPKITEGEKATIEGEIESEISEEEAKDIEENRGNLIKN
ncbi:P-loop containing nucleoside triphosphate hydrolase protein [Yarrowia lipolytica]|nr:P-loop containing nucleoside triphosphate hydrolase protein [Yarrowia lipolytica]RDW56316.1 P-loop containing nucleoside triphosphate hydrolase protein [Yarrowia lipolytica]